MLRASTPLHFGRLRGENRKDDGHSGNRYISVCDSYQQIQDRAQIAIEQSCARRTVGTGLYRHFFKHAAGTGPYGHFFKYAAGTRLYRYFFKHTAMIDSTG